MPHRAWTTPTLRAFGVGALSRDVQQIHHFTFVGFGGARGLDSMPGCIDYIQHEGETELTWRQVVALGRQRDDGPHQIVGRHRGKQFLLHHAFGAGGNVMQPHRSFQRA